jgi:hypothetical protein
VLKSISGSVYRSKYQSRTLIYPRIFAPKLVFLHYLKRKCLGDVVFRQAKIFGYFINAFASFPSALQNPSWNAFDIWSPKRDARATIYLTTDAI